jgi:hypothetical protein
MDKITKYLDGPSMNQTGIVSSLAQRTFMETADHGHLL